MNRRIYYDGALINKIGIDRIVIKKVVLKEINAEKLDTALTCCAIHYDKVIVEGRQFYLTEKDNKFNYLKIDDNELGTLTFGVKNKQYGIYQFSPKEMWGGTNLVNYSAKEIHEFIEDAKIKLKDKYGLEVDFDDSEIREIELNTTFATKHKFSAYRREGTFNPQNIVLFGYSFNYVEMENLKTNVKILRDSEKNLKINLDVRY